MCMTYYTVDDLHPGRPGWDVRQFSALAEAIDHYRALPMDGIRVLGMADDAHAYELIRCVRLFPGDVQGEDVLAADYRRSGLAKKNADLKTALDICLETLHPRFLLEPGRLVPVPQSGKLRGDLREALLWQGYEENYESAIRSVFVGGVGWISPQDVEKRRQLPLVLSLIVSISQFYRNYSVVLSRRMRNMSCISLIFFTKKALRILILFRCCRFCYVSGVLFRLRQIYRNTNLSILGICGPFL